MTFQQFIEASTADMDLIKSHIDDIKGRPFAELFGSVDRFITKVPNEKLAQIMRNNEITLQDILKFSNSKGGSKRFAAKYSNINEKDLQFLKQSIDQNNFYNCLLWSRHPADVIRMSDFGRIKSCHSLNGSRRHCTISDAQNAGGIVFLITNSDAARISNRLTEQDIIFDKQRGVGYIVPQGRIRLRNFVDTRKSYSFAVPVTILQYGSSEYGINPYKFPKYYEDKVVNFCRQHQSIYKQNPSIEYLIKNVVLLGGQDTDIHIHDLLSIFFHGRVKSDQSYGRMAIRQKVEQLNDLVEIRNLLKKYNGNLIVDKDKNKIVMNLVLKSPLLDITTDNIRRKIDLLQFIKYGILSGRANGYITQLNVSSGKINLSFEVRERDIGRYFWYILYRRLSRFNLNNVVKQYTINNSIPTITW